MEGEFCYGFETRDGSEGDRWASGRREDNMKMEWDGDVDWIYLDQDCYKRRAAMTLEWNFSFRKVKGICWLTENLPALLEGLLYVVIEVV